MQFKSDAIAISNQSSHKVFKHGALLVRGNYILSTGYNDYKNHAEVNAINNYIQQVLQGKRNQAKTENKLRRIFSRCDLLVVRAKRLTISNSKPCKHCLQFIKDCGIRRIYYSNNQNLILEKTSDMQTEHICSSKLWKQQKK